MRVLTFQPQFHDHVRSGQKTSTIRDKARCKPGDELSLRRWIGMPYRTKQELLIPNQVCTAVTAIKMEIGPDGEFRMGLDVSDVFLKDPLWMWLAKDDVVISALAMREGFPGYAAMCAWFIKAKKIRPGKPYIGHQIEWKYLTIPT